MARHLLLVGSAAALLAGAADPCQSPQSAREGGDARTTLRVAMFPYLPALGAGGELAKRIEQEFEGQHPDVDLELTIDPGINGCEFEHTVAGDRMRINEALFATVGTSCVTRG